MPRRLNEEELSRKRQQIIDAARELFIRHGYTETTVSLIAERAGLPVSSLYNYFKSKDEIFKAAGLSNEIYELRPEYDRKRKAILDSSLKLMGEYGFSSVTLDQIAAQVGIPRASFYQFFDSKEDLFSTLLAVSPLQESACELDADANDPLCINGLFRLGQSYLDMGDLPERNEIFKMAVHESREHPDTGKLFYSEGIYKVCESLAAYLKREPCAANMSEKQLRLAAWVFLSTLWANNILFKVIKGAERDFSDSDILQLSVEVFSAWLEKNNAAIEP